MLSLENLSKSITENLNKQLALDEEKVSVIQYGLYAFFQIGLSILLVAIVGAMFNVTIEALIISFIISIFRKYSGGVHASTPINCLIMGIVISVLPALIIDKFHVDIINIILIGVIVFIISIFITYRLAPVDSPNKPIRKMEKIKRLKKESIIILVIYIILSALSILIYYYTKNDKFLIYCNCIYVGVLWQVITLTKLGSIIVGIVDSLLIKILN